MTTSLIARMRIARVRLARVRIAGIARVLAPATLAIGYVDLARGGTTIAPLCLVAAYLVFVPIVLLEWR